MQIGIGILSYNRPASLEKCLASLFENLAYTATVAVSFDQWNDTFERIASQYPINAITGTQRGIPFANNRLIRFFDGCEAVFLVQDDMRFLRPEWLERYTDGIRHVPYLAFFDPYYPQTTTHPRHYLVNYYRRRRVIKNGVAYWLCHKSPQGAFQALGRTCIEQVGYFDTGFGVYGLEHHDYWLRTCNEGMSPHDHFYDIEHSAELLKMDWQQPHSLAEAERNASSKQSKSWRHNLFVASDKGFKRIWHGAPLETVRVVQKQADSPGKQLPPPDENDWLMQLYWVYRQRIPILAYHSISEAPHDRYAVSPQLFRTHLEKLAPHFHFITASQAYTHWCLYGELPQDAVLLTFDDAYDDVAEIAPLLDEFEAKVTVFAPADWVGRVNEWDHGAFTRRRHMDFNTLRTLHDMGHEIGSHACSHYRLPMLPLNDARQEVVYSRQTLEENLGCAVKTLAYPFGSTSSALLDTVSEHYDLGFVAGGGGVLDWQEDPFTIRRITVNSHDDPYHLLSKIADYMMQAPVSEPVWWPTRQKPHEHNY